MYDLAIIDHTKKSYIYFFCCFLSQDFAFYIPIEEYIKHIWHLASRKVMKRKTKGRWVSTTSNVLVLHRGDPHLMPGTSFGSSSLLRVIPEHRTKSKTWHSQVKSINWNGVGKARCWEATPLRRCRHHWKPWLDVQFGVVPVSQWNYLLMSLLKRA